MIYLNTKFKIFLLFTIITYVSILNANELTSDYTNKDIQILNKNLSLITYELNYKEIEEVLLSYLKNNKKAYAIQIFDFISKEFIFSSYKDTNIISLKKKNFPRGFIKPRESLTRNIYYRGIKIAELTVFFDIPINLTQKELNYLINNKIFRINTYAEYKPYSYVLNNKALGFGNDFMRLLAKELKVDVLFKTTENIQLLNDIKNNNIHMINARPAIKYFNKDLLYSDKAMLNLTNIFLTKNLKINHFQQLEGKTLGLVNGYFLTKYIKKYYPKIKIITCSSVSQCIDFVNKNKVTASHHFLHIAETMLSNKKITNLKINKALDIKNTNLYIAYNKSNQILKNIIDKLLNNFNHLELFKFQLKVLNRLKYNKDELLNTIYTKEELDYINTKHIIKLCSVPNYLPYSKITKEKKFIGTVANFINKIKEHTTLKIEPIYTSSWKESHDFIKNKKCDFIPFLMKTEDRKKYLNFTKSYTNISLVLLTKDEVPFIDDIKDVRNKKFALMGSLKIKNFIQQKYPNIKIIEVANSKEGFKKIQKGEVFAYISTLANISYNLKEDHIVDLKISGKLDTKLEIFMATRKNDYILKNILEKSILTVNELDKTSILNSWQDIHIHEFDKEFFYKIIFTIVFILLLIIFFLVLYWNRKLKKLNDQLNILSKTDNRLMINEIFQQEISRFKRYETPISIIMLDIDYFKKINDTYGHNIGDFVLIEFAKVVKTNIRETDHLGRWGGEEFVVVCTNTHLKGAVNLANSLKKAITNIDINNKYKLTCSFGVSELKKDQDLESLIKSADDALYQAKNEGRNKVCINL